MENIQHLSFVVKYVEVLPPTTPCPDCGVACKRNSMGHRLLSVPDLDRPTFLAVCVGVYHCSNSACHRKYFRMPLPFAGSRSRYTDQAKALCVAGVTRDAMPFRRVPERAAEDVHLYPVQSTIWDWHRQECETIDLADTYEPWVTAQFSGVLCIDEVYDGPFCVILSTDPLNDVTVAYTIETKDVGQQRPMLKQDWLDRHLAVLRRMGIHPQAVIRDGAVVYDAGLPSEWEQARCHFHIVQDIAEDVLKAVKAYRKTLPDPPKRPMGRPRAEAPPPEPDGKTEIWHHRYLFVTRPSTLLERRHSCSLGDASLLPAGRGGDSPGSVCGACPLSHGPSVSAGRVGPLCGSRRLLS